MRLPAPLLRVPLAFDATRLAEEVERLPPGAWLPHRRFPKCMAILPLVAPGGDAGASVPRGPMAPTPHLARCRYLREVLGALEAELGFVQLLRLAPGGEVPAHADASYYWIRRLRVHVPIVTNPGVAFRCGDASAHLPAGSCWVHDTWLPHGVVNRGEDARIHLVADTVGSPALSALLSRSGAARHVAPRDGGDAGGALATERSNFPVVMSPADQDELVALLVDESAAGGEGDDPLVAELRRFQSDWRELWRAHEARPSGWAAYKARLATLDAALRGLERRRVLPNGLDAAEAARELLVRPAFNPDLAAPPRRRAPRPREEPAAPAPPGAEAGAIASVHSESLVELLHARGTSLLLTVRPGAELLVARSTGSSIDVLVRRLPGARGVALGARSLAVASAREVLELRNVPAAARALRSRDAHDGCFLPRATRVTGAIEAHDLAFAGDELWIANTRFSCLATLDAEHSFVPRWRPPFVGRLAPDDRCHLNGIAVVDGAPGFVTAHGASDLPQGWRRDARGGVVVDVRSGEIVASGLSLPHSPRWHLGRLWLLESGRGTLATLDVASGRVTTVAELPGFTRGLGFLGTLAFVGLSRVRESALDDLPLRERAGHGACGVAAVDLTSGRTVGFLRFTSGPAEVLDLAVLPGVRFPALQVGSEGAAAEAFVLPAAALAENA